MRSNTKEVRLKVREHILDQIDNDIELLKGNLDAVKYGKIQTVYQCAQELVSGGSFLIYNGEISDFLNSLGINQDNKTFSDEKSFELYKHLIASEIEKLV